MLRIHPSEKLVATQDIIGLSDLALRWPYWAIFKIPLHLGTRHLPVYVWQDEATRPDGHKIHRIYETNRYSDFDWLLARMPLILFLRTDVEELECEYPEYQATKSLGQDENQLLLATKDNLPQLVPLILRAWGLVNGNADKMIDSLLRVRHDGSDPFIESILAGNGVTLEQDKIQPTFLLDFDKRKAFTTFERAQEFVKICAPKDAHDVCLAVIEVDRRFSHLTNRQIGALFPSQSTIDEDSVKRRGGRLREEAQKYKKLPYDHPVP